MILRYHLKDLKKLAASKLDLFKWPLFDIFLSGVSLLHINVLISDKIEPRPHVAQLLKHIVVKLSRLDCTAFLPTAVHSLAKRQLARIVKFADAGVLAVAPKMLVHLAQDKHKHLACISLLVPLEVV